jgi:hypothetical protein
MAPRWQVYTFRFRAGDTYFTRTFTETSFSAAQQVARVWGEAKGYVLAED